MRHYRIPTYKVRLVRERATIKCNTPDKAGDILTELCTKDDQSREVMWCLYLNGQSNIIGGECVAMGGSSGLCITPSDILRGAIVAGARAIILGHNHPSGNPEPSDEDYNTTTTLMYASEVVGIELVDHIVVTAHNGYRSLACMAKDIFKSAQMR